MVLLIFALGVVMGALVNRLATDLPARRPPQRPLCPYCGQRRPLYQWVALPSYVLGRGRCPQCSAQIPLRYPLVELALGFLFAFLYLRYGLGIRLLFHALYTAVFALVTVTDLERRLILNVVTFPAMALALVGALLLDGITWWSALLGGLIGYLFFLIAAWIGNATVGPGALGGGDVKLAAFVGLVVGFPLVVEALLLTVLSGGLVSLILLLARRRSLRDPIPYGPYLVLGGWVTMVWGFSLADLLLLS